MAMEMRQQLKMTQQLVMTPQLQQAIKLLQLTRLELQDVVRQELEENPLLEETPEVDEIRDNDQAELTESEETPELAGDDFKEVETGDETLRDWDSYLDGYTYSSGEQYRDDEDRPSLESLLTRSGTLADHLLWQLHMGHFSEEEVGIGEEIMGTSMTMGTCAPRWKRLQRRVRRMPSRFSRSWCVSRSLIPAALPPATCRSAF